MKELRLRLVHKFIQGDMTNNDVYDSKASALYTMTLTVKQEIFEKSAKTNYINQNEFAFKKITLFKSEKDLMQEIRSLQTTERTRRTDSGLDRNKSQRNSIELAH